MRELSRWLRWLGIASCFVGCVSHASDYFLTIGGGYNPQGNQVSLERNVEFFRQVLAEQRPDAPPNAVFFADGDDSQRDLQYRDPSFQCLPARRIAIELFGDVDDIDISYRNHTVRDVRQATSPRHIRNYLHELGKRISGDDRLIIYTTAHGGSGDERTPYNTSVYTWNHRRFSAAEFTDWLDRLPQQTPVVLVMVQCYAGGFAYTQFNDADPKQGVARQLRAGFFAQVHDRPAAGCTPDVNEDSYQEYSSFFWAALAGHDRSGATIEQVDLDGDGVTSFAEAHAYAVCESETIDIPMRTSDAYLKYFSTDGTTVESQYHRDRKSSPPRRLPVSELAKVDGSFGQLLAIADPVDRAIVKHLAMALQLNIEGDLNQIDQAMDRARQLIRRTRQAASKATSAHRRARDRVVSDVRREWPELDAELSPKLAALMAEQADEFEQKVTALRSYKTMSRLADDKQKTSQEALNAKKDEALVLRLKHTVNRVVLAANLPEIASPQVVDRYRELMKLESSSLLSARESNLP